MNLHLLNIKSLTALFFFLQVVHGSYTLNRGIEPFYKFKYIEAKKEYDDQGKDVCFQKAPQVQTCGKISFALQNVSDAQKQAAYENCLKGLSLHEFLVAEAAEIEPETFYDNAAFKDEYLGAVKAYVKALDKKYKDTGTTIESGLTFEFQWIPWVLFLVAAAAVYAFNREKKPESGGSVESADQVVQKQPESVYENV